MKGITFFLLLVSFSALHSQPVTLRDTTNQYNYIIITVPEFVNACEPFRQHKETVRDFRTLIVDTTQIFAEFDSSSTPQDNIRDFISYAGTFWKEPRPKFFLIVGTVSDVPNFPIPFHSPDTIYYYSDYYYGVSTYGAHSGIIDFSIGRIPAKNITEIENYFNKVIDYESKSTLESWMNNAQFICQDAEYYDFLNSAFYLSSQFPSFIRSYYVTENDTSQYYGNIDSIYNAINNRGSALVWFLGFGKDSLFRLSDSSWIGVEELNGLSNYQKYFFTFFFFNQSSIIDSNTNLTREMIVMQDAGSLGGTVFVGITVWGINWLFQRLWAQRFFNPSIQSISEVTTLDSLIPSGGLYGYMLKITNLWADPSLKLKYDTTVGVEKAEDEIPHNFILYQNYPNPFNPTTTIKFALPVNSKVKINVYNSLGQLVETLVDKEMESGYHEVNFNASRLSSGVYLYQLQSGEYVSVKKMLMIK
jgi:hypothetical protein